MDTIKGLVKSFLGIESTTQTKRAKRGREEEDIEESNSTTETNAKKRVEIKKERISDDAPAAIMKEEEEEERFPETFGCAPSEPHLTDALELAVEKNNTQMVNSFLKAGVVVTKSMVREAFQMSYGDEMVEALVEAIPKDCETDVFNEGLSRSDSVGRFPTLFMMATSRLYSAKILDRMVSLGADVNFTKFMNTTNTTYTAMHYLLEEQFDRCRNPSNYYYPSSPNRKRVLETIEFLLDKGARIDIKGGNLNRTPVEWAVASQYEDVVAIMMARVSTSAATKSNGKENQKGGKKRAVAKKTSKLGKKTSRK